MLRRHLLAATAAGIAAPATLRAQGAWRPDRPVTIIVPWAAGGSTDQVTRIVATELEEALGQRFVVVNQPGASGSIGTRNVMQAAKDGYTWAAGAAVDVGCYKVLGLLDTALATEKNRCQSGFRLPRLRAVAAGVAVAARHRGGDRRAILRRTQHDGGDPRRLPPGDLSQRAL